MQTIADTIHISKNSVSQALTGKDGVSEETRRLVFETAEKLGYVYSETRKKKQQERSRTIALIASEYAFSQRSFFGEIYLAIEKECSERGISLLIQSVNTEARDRLILPSVLDSQTIDGVLILSHISTEYINAILETNIPAILIDHHHPDIHADCILTNNRFAGYEAVRYLIQLGHQKIGYWGNVNISPSYYERFEAYLRAMNDASLPVDPEWVVKDAIEDINDMQKKLSNMKAFPTAWFCVNDGLGFLLISSLNQLGIKVPDDISVCSFDNGQLSQISSPPTTTVTIDLPIYGRKAVEQLLWRIDNPNEPHMEILLPAKLIPRESTRQLTS
ncbi:substrate-binding domain-containing protein [Paenibacillus rhizovicinus]|uniref:Substrate-binding domain-containing protein n=2 Tax=Paenibacillus rhizovicinus TaxID=2704463 RepID=A0A6C0PBN3_9BACL|nr:substrate-binding domain-containing protein [Paenibacillus rhizovicinus]